MPKYFEVRPDIFARQVATYVGAPLSAGAFLVGTRLEAAPPVPLLYETGFSSNDRLPELLCIGEPILTRGLVEELANAGVANMEIFPAELKSTVDGTCWDHYLAVNFVGSISCADLSRSEFEEVMVRPGSGRRQLYSFSDLKIDVKLAEGALVFRLAESPLVLLMSALVVDRLTAAKPAKVRRISFIDRS